MTYVALTCGILLAGAVALVLLAWALCAAGAMADKARLSKMVDDGENWP